MAAKIVTREIKKTYVQAVQGENGKVRQSNNRLDERLQAGEQFGWTRSGTDLVYTRPGEKLGSEIRFFDLRFGIPRKYQKLKDVALELESPSVSVTTTSSSAMSVVQGKVKGVVEEFPAEDGWYLVDAKGIPQGKQVSSIDPSARRLWRRDIDEDEGNGYIGSAVRGYDDYHWPRVRDVVLDYEPSTGLGVEYETRARPARPQAVQANGLVVAQAPKELQVAVGAVLRSRAPAEEVVARLAEAAELGIGVSKKDLQKLWRHLADTGRLEI